MQATGYFCLELIPVIINVIAFSALQYIGNMRCVLHHILIYVPHFQVHRVGEAQPSVLTEYCQTFMQVIKRCPLYSYKRIVRPLQRQTVSYIFIDKEYSSKCVRNGENAKGTTVRKVEKLFMAT